MRLKSRERKISYFDTINQVRAVPNRVDHTQAIIELDRRGIRPPSFKRRVDETGVHILAYVEPRIIRKRVEIALER